MDFRAEIDATLIWLIAAYLVAINLIVFIAFGMDKFYAARGYWRIQEKTLLILSFLGGWGGAKVGQSWFRHKTRKQPFRRILDSIPIMHLGAGMILLGWSFW